MEYGFNCKTHRFEKMYDYDVVSILFNYDDEYLNQNVQDGLANLESIFNAALDKLDTSNTHFVLQLQNEEELDIEDYVSLFSTFGILLAQKGTPNKKGYLAPNDSFRERVSGTNYSKIAILNTDFDFGIIQLTIEDERGYLVKWVNQQK